MLVFARSDPVELLTFSHARGKVFGRLSLAAAAIAYCMACINHGPHRARCLNYCHEISLERVANYGMGFTWF